MRAYLLLPHLETLPRGAQTMLVDLLTQEEVRRLEYRREKHKGQTFVGGISQTI